MRRKARRPNCHHARDAAKKAAATDDFKKAMGNLGQEVAYLDQPEF